MVSQILTSFPRWQLFESNFVLEVFLGGTARICGSILPANNKSDKPYANASPYKYSPHTSPGFPPIDCPQKTRMPTAALRMCRQRGKGILSALCLCFDIKETLRTLVLQRRRAVGTLKGSVLRLTSSKSHKIILCPQGIGFRV